MSYIVSLFCVFSAIIDCKAAIDFSSLNHLEAFGRLINVMRTFFDQANYSVLQQACIMHIKNPDGLQFSGEAKLVRKIMKSNELKELLLVLTNSDYWNWLDTRLLEAMVNATELIEAKRTLEKYYEHISQLKLNKVFYDIPICLFSFSYYDTVEKKFDKNKNELTVGDIRKHKFHLEKLSKTADIKLWKIKTGCLEFLWLIPKQCTKQVYDSALNDDYKFDDALMYTKIENFPTIFSPSYAVTKEISSGKDYMYPQSSCSALVQGLLQSGLNCLLQNLKF